MSNPGESKLDHAHKDVDMQLLAVHNERKEGSALYANLDPDQRADFDFLEGIQSERKRGERLAEALEEVKRYAHGPTTCVAREALEEWRKK